MKKPIYTIFILTLVCASLSAHSAIAQVMSGAPIILFDGKTTSGWSKANGKSHDGWVVEDGLLHRKSGGGDLFHQGVYRDFVLHFQWKISKGGNSGVKYRVRKYGDSWLGCEYQLLDDQNAKEHNKTACLYDVYQPADHKPVVVHNVWQASKIVVCGNRIEHWLNGVLVVQTRVGSPDWHAKVAQSKFRDREKFGQNREGRIFLQDHGNPVWFRQIVLVPLNCDQRLPVAEALTYLPPAWQKWQSVNSMSMNAPPNAFLARGTGRQMMCQPVPGLHIPCENHSSFGWPAPFPDCWPQPQQCPCDRRAGRPALFLRQR